MTPGTWTVDPADGKVSGSGSQTEVFAGQSYTLNATWSGAVFDTAAQKMTSGTVALSFATGPATGAVGLDIVVVGLSVDAATGIATITGGTIGAPATDGNVGLTMPHPIDLTGSTVVLSPAGLIYVSCTLHDPITILGVNLPVGAVLKADLSATEAAPGNAIPDADLPSGATGGPWRGIRIEGATVAFGDTPAAGSGVATLDFLNVGWPGAVTGNPAFKGRVTATNAAPLAGKIFGVEVLLKPVGTAATATLDFDSTQITGAAHGTFDGTVKLPGGDSAAISGFSVSYSRGEGFQFVVESAVVTSPTAGMGLGLGAWSAHATRIGLDASETQNLASLPAPAHPLSWKGLIIYEGTLQLPVPGAHDGSELVLDLKDIVLPLDHPGNFDGWLLLKSGSSNAVARIGDLEIQATDTPQAPLQSVAASEVPGDAVEAASVLGHTHFHFTGGNLVSGCLYGLLKIPGTPDVPFGATVDADGNVIAGVTVPEIKVGQGDSGITFSDVQATLDLSQATSPDPQSASPEWTGLVLISATVTLPSPFEGTLTAEDLVWDHGLSGTLSATDLQSIGVGNTDKFAATLTSFSITFSHGDVESVDAAGTLVAKPFLDQVTFTTEYDSATGYVLKADLDGQPHVFGAVGGVLEITFTALEIKVPTKDAHDNHGARASIRMDGSVSVHTTGVSSTGFKFEDVGLRSDGTVNSGGAWIDLREHGHWEFQKFAVDVREVGFGSVPSTTVPGEHQVWVGLSGGLALSDMWGMSVDVQANKFRWFEDKGFAVEEVKIEATVKKTVSIKGKVKYLETPVKKEFRGQVAVEVAVASGKFAAEIQFVSGHQAGFNYWGVAGSFQLPTAVPLGATGLGLYGVNGGVSKHLTPTGVNLYDWTPSATSGFAFQAGVTIGTYADQGYTFHGGVTMTVLIAPLIIRIDGTGNLLTLMTDISNADRVVKASVVYDSTTSTFDASLELGQSDAQPFQLPHVLSVRGMAILHIEATRAYFHLGTKANPVTARVFPDIGGGITASTWFMFDWNKTSNPKIAASVGAYVGWSFTKSFKLCDVTGTIAAGGEVNLTLSPFTFNGSLSASIGAQACGVGFDLSANCSASYPAIHLHADCTLKIDLAIKTVTLSVAVEQP